MGNTNFKEFIRKTAQEIDNYYAKLHFLDEMEVQRNTELQAESALTLRSLQKVYDEIDDISIENFDWLMNVNVTSNECFVMRLSKVLGGEYMDLVKKMVSSTLSEELKYAGVVHKWLSNSTSSKGIAQGGQGGVAKDVFFNIDPSVVRGLGSIVESIDLKEKFTLDSKKEKCKAL